MHLEFQPADAPDPDAQFSVPPEQITAELLELCDEFFRQASPIVHTELRHFLAEHGYHPSGLGWFIDALGFTTLNRTAPPDTRHQTRVEMSHVEEVAGGHGQRGEQRGAARGADIGVPRRQGPDNGAVGNRPKTQVRWRFLRFLADVPIRFVNCHHGKTDGLLRTRWGDISAYRTRAGAMGTNNERSCCWRHARPSR